VRWATILLPCSPEPITLSRACEVIDIPSGTRGTLPAGAVVRIMQSLAGSCTATDRGYMDTDALGLSNAAMPQEPALREGPFSEQTVWDQLKTTCAIRRSRSILWDPGLVYSCDIAPLELGGNSVHIKMSMTVPGCGMGNVLKADVQNKLARLPVSRKITLMSCSIRHGIPASCRKQLRSSLAATWITAPRKPRHRCMEKESDLLHFAQKTLDLCAG
jgi:metal-sulfur cluster biosynthetic enzyme